MTPNPTPIAGGELNKIYFILKVSIPRSFPSFLSTGKGFIKNDFPSSSSLEGKTISGWNLGFSKNISKLSVRVDPFSDNMGCHHLLFNRMDLYGGPIFGEA